MLRVENVRPTNDERRATRCADGLIYRGHLGVGHIHESTRVRGIRVVVMAIAADAHPNCLRRRAGWRCTLRTRARWHGRACYHHRAELAARTLLEVGSSHEDQGATSRCTVIWLHEPQLRLDVIMHWRTRAFWCSLSSHRHLGIVVTNLSGRRRLTCCHSRGASHEHPTPRTNIAIARHVVHYLCSEEGDHSTGTSAHDCRLHCIDTRRRDDCHLQ
mmetsp:Transcript_12852/g.54011  ORF Transcript_12852/g.54011 Transcript_12852/m.54011 type:complete len:216 (-) Transcript_12852:2101-2748(-)